MDRVDLPEVAVNMALVLILTVERIGHSSDKVVISWDGDYPRNARDWNRRCAVIRTISRHSTALDCHAAAR